MLEKDIIRFRVELLDASKRYFEEKGNRVV